MERNEQKKRKTSLFVRKTKKNRKIKIKLLIKLSGAHKTKHHNTISLKLASSIKQNPHIDTSSWRECVSAHAHTLKLESWWCVFEGEKKRFGWQGACFHGGDLFEAVTILSSGRWCVWKEHDYTNHRLKNDLEERIFYRIRSAFIFFIVDEEECIRDFG